MSLLCYELEPYKINLLSKWPPNQEEVLPCIKAVSSIWTKIGAISDTLAPIASCLVEIKTSLYNDLKVNGIPWRLKILGWLILLRFWIECGSVLVC
jgi:hypothetical protein